MISHGNGKSGCISMLSPQAGFQMRKGIQSGMYELPVSWEPIPSAYRFDQYSTYVQTRELIPYLVTGLESFSVLKKLPGYIAWRQDY